MPQVEFASRPDIASDEQSRITVDVGTFSQAYRLWETSAPAAYDYHGTLTVYGDPSPDDGSTRFVLIPVASILETDNRDHGREPGQVTRYRSGLYATCRADLFDRAMLTELLVKALQGALYKGRE